MAQPSIYDVLTNSLSPEASVRSAATQQLESFANSAFPEYLQALTTELVSESAQSHIRNAAGLAIKNALAAKEAETKESLAQRWIGLAPEARQHIKSSALNTLASSDRGARNVAGQIIAAIAVIELPHDAWPDLIDQLMGFSSQPNPQLKQATLQTIGYICEAIVSRPGRSLCILLCPPSAPQLGMSNCYRAPSLTVLFDSFSTRNLKSCSPSPTRSSPSWCKALARRKKTKRSSWPLSLL